ncbi:hypothetical protein NDU88_005415 [Pleurodeles waltl]|uniref:Secreted protein n=1 Tax=Pleurodeles waltl TaxID=8319 RepID=A0AAV7SLT8_PLEWA|nr:hypothetical protein NDU88_005415 [Pleurodeles waltl]
MERMRTCWRLCGSAARACLLADLVWPRARSGLHARVPAEVPGWACRSALVYGEEPGPGDGRWTDCVGAVEEQLDAAG